MGKSWKIINVDKREYTARGAKLLELLWSNEASVLIDLLKVPTLLKVQVHSGSLSARKNRQYAFNY